jgi:hypothetical protein
MTMDTASAKYYVSWFRWQAQDGYALWLTMPYEDALWADSCGKVPVFSSLEDVEAFAARLGLSVEQEPLRLQNLDAVIPWMRELWEVVPCNECLTAWNMFDDLSSGIAKEFIGNRKGPARNRVYDKLFFGSGVVGINQQGRAELTGPHTRPWIPKWRLQERKVLRRVLQQGFRLWKKYTYRATAAEVNLPA